MIPNLLGLIAMIIVSRHSDRTLERRYHMATSVALAGIALLLLGAPHSPFYRLFFFQPWPSGHTAFYPFSFRCPANSSPASRQLRVLRL